MCQNCTDHFLGVYRPKYILKIGIVNSQNLFIFSLRIGIFNRYIIIVEGKEKHQKKHFAIKLTTDLDDNILTEKTEKQFKEKTNVEIRI